jgi:hypothetical protein
VADNATGLSTQYSADGQIIGTPVTIPTPTGVTPPSAPNGNVFNTTNDFVISHDGKSAPATVIFSSENGTIVGFNLNTGQFLGQLTSANGQTLILNGGFKKEADTKGLWGLTFGDGQNGAATNSLFFAAGINDENDGLFGKVTVSGEDFGQNGIVKKAPHFYEDYNGPKLDQLNAVAAAGELLPDGSLPQGSFSAEGRVIAVTVPGSLLPSTGLPPSQFRFNYWPENPDPALTEQIASFTPEFADQGRAAGLLGRPADHRRPGRCGPGIDQVERDLDLIRESHQFGALGDQEAASIVVELHAAEQGPPSCVRRPGAIFMSAGSGCEVRQCQDGQVDAGTAAIVAVGLRVDTGHWAQASRHNLAVGDQGQGAALASLESLVGLLAQDADGEEPGQHQARRDQRGQAPAQGLETGADPALGRA